MVDKKVIRMLTWFVLIGALTAASFMPVSGLSDESEDFPGARRTATPSLTVTPSSMPGPPELISPQDGAVLPQPVAPGLWDFWWNTKSWCSQVLYIEGPNGVQLAFPANSEFQYQSNEYIPDESLSPWYWWVSVGCFAGSNISEKRMFSVQPIHSPTPTSTPTCLTVPGKPVLIAPRGKVTVRQHLAGLILPVLQPTNWSFEKIPRTERSSFEKHIYLIRHIHMNCQAGTESTPGESQPATSWGASGRIGPHSRPENDFVRVAYSHRSVLRYFNPESGSRTAIVFPACPLCSKWSAAATFAPEEKPAKIPSSFARRRATSMAC